MISIRMPPNPDRHITGKSVYCLYLGMKNHFKGKYDLIKYNWVIKVSDKAYQKRRDKYFFERLSENYKLKELVFLLMSNLVSNQDAWIGDLSDSDAIDFYRKYVVKLKSIKDTFVDDVKNIYYFSKKMNISLNEVFSYNEKIGSTYLFKMLQSEIINAESFLILDSFLDLINKFDTDIDNILWNNYSIRLSAYKKIFKIDNETAKQLFIKTVKNLKET